MKLKDYIEQGYAVLTFEILSRKIKEKYPNAKIHDQNFKGDKKLLIDEYARYTDFIREFVADATDMSFRRFTKEFCGELYSDEYEIQNLQKRKQQTLTVTGPRVDLIEETIVSIIKLHSRNMEEDDDLINDESMQIISNTKYTVFIFWSDDQQLLEIKKGIFSIYDVHII